MSYCWTLPNRNIAEDRSQAGMEPAGIVLYPKEVELTIEIFHENI